MTSEEAVKWYKAAEDEAMAIRLGERGPRTPGPIEVLRDLSGILDREGGRLPWRLEAPGLLFASRERRERWAAWFQGWARENARQDGHCEITNRARQFAAALLLAID